MGVTLGRALMKSAAGDSVVLQLPGGTENLTVLEVVMNAFLSNSSVPHFQAGGTGFPFRHNKIKIVQRNRIINVQRN